MFIACRGAPAKDIRLKGHIVEICYAGMICASQHTEGIKRDGTRRHKVWFCSFIWELLSALLTFFLCDSIISIIKEVHIIEFYIR